MELVLQVLMVVALFFCYSSQLGTGAFAPPSSILRSAKRLSNGYSTGMGPYDIHIELVHQCADHGTNLFKDTLEIYNTRTDTGSKMVYRGNFTMPLTQEQINTLEVKIIIIRVKDKKEFQMIKYEENFCETVIGHGKETFMSAKEKIGLKGEGCEMPKGVYSFSNWDIKLAGPQAVMEFGKYKGTVEILYEKKIACCYEIIGEVKQKY